ncbi:Hypothetical predicted protein [Podarcis lilfordi]|uniref:Uncharacterized protein n=1 Tax=Podarcis lilfordi TaxID=74358 RepID=A0AA35LD17_9SAUR|nr:Hypothetical predicted protein [Podarcis lilfordi]
MGLAHLLAPRLAPSLALLLVARLAAMLEQLEGKLHATCPALRMRGLPIDLASDDGPQYVVRTARKLHRDRPMEQLLLINNAGVQAAPIGAPEHVQSALLLQVQRQLRDQL